MCFIGTISILFRTSQSKRFSGFEATVICFKREDADQPGKNMSLCSVLYSNYVSHHDWAIFIAGHCFYNSHIVISLYKENRSSLTGCTRPGQNDTEVTTLSPGRRRRDLDEFVSIFSVI